MASVSLQSALAADPPAAIGAATSNTPEPAADINSIFSDLQRLVKEFYPNAKMTLADNKLHFAFRTRNLYGFNSRRIAETPLSDGILGDVAVQQGIYQGSDKEMLPSDIVDGDGATLTMAPLSRSRNSHLLAKLAYPTDVPVEFKDRFKSIVAGFNANETIGAPVSSGPVPTPEIVIQKQAPEVIYKNISAMVKEYYPQATISIKGNTMHFERKAKREFEYYTRKLEIGAEPGGIVGDVDLAPGPYKGVGKERMPTETFQGFWSTITMAPFSKAQNAHLYAKLVCPEGTASTFKARFRSEIDSFNAGE